MQIGTNHVMKIVIGGVSNTGKSTLVASFAWKLKVRAISLDVWDNTLPYICKGLAVPEDRPKVPKGYVKDERIYLAIEQFKRTQGVIIGDLPGGKIANCVKEMVGCADVAIVIGRDQASIEYWQDVFRVFNKKVLCSIQTYLFNKPDYELTVGGINRRIIESSELDAIASFIKPPLK
jgi:GTPase SAR1 family protein